MSGRHSRGHEAIREPVPGGVSSRSRTKVDEPPEPVEVTGRAIIILMVALAVYSEEAEPWSCTPFMDLMVVVFAPLTALSLAHAFSDALDVQIRTGKRLSAKERRHLLGIAV